MTLGALHRAPVSIINSEIIQASFAHACIPYAEPARASNQALSARLYVHLGQVLDSKRMTLGLTIAEFGTWQASSTCSGFHRLAQGLIELPEVTLGSFV